MFTFIYKHKSIRFMWNLLSTLLKIFSLVSKICTIRVVPYYIKWIYYKTKKKKVKLTAFRMCPANQYCCNIVAIALIDISIHLVIIESNFWKPLILDRYVLYIFYYEIFSIIYILNNKIFKVKFLFTLTDKESTSAVTLLLYFEWINNTLANKRAFFREILKKMYLNFYKNECKTLQ